MNVQMIQGFMLAVGADKKYDVFNGELGEAVIKAVEVTLLGLGMVFLVLAILWGVLAIFKVLFSGEKKVEKTTNADIPVAPVAEPEPVEAEADDGELIAVITAAIEAYRASESGGDENYAGGFRVVSFKRAGAGRPWNSK